MIKDDIIRIARQAGSLIEAAQEKDLLWLERFAALVASAERERIKQANAPEIERINSYIKKLEALAQTDYKSTSDYQFMENVQGELERIKLVQTGVGIEQRAEEAYEAAKHRSWVGVSDEVAQPEQDWIERERAVGYREGHMAALSQRKWVGLTDAEVKKIVGSDRYTDLLLEVVNFVEAKLKEKNCG